jgi:nucleoside-diphosphate-sugar epimerase
MKRVLVTGATGFVGRHCLLPLIERGYEVHALSRAAGRPLSVPGVQWHGLDLLRDTGRLESLLADLRCSHLLHLAWFTEPGKYWTAPENLQWVSGSLRLVDAFAGTEGRRLVVAGSCAEVDWASSVVSDGMVLSCPRTLYGWSKLSLYLVLAAYASRVSLSLGWGRLFFMYGPHEHPARLVPNVATALLKKSPAPCSHGRQVRDFLFVHDVADALTALLDSTVEGPVNIVSGQTHTVAQVVHQIASLLRGEHLIRWGAVPTSPDEPVQLVGEARRLREEIHWSPRFSLAEGIAQTVSWWQEQLQPKAA